MHINGSISIHIPSFIDQNIDQFPSNNQIQPDAVDNRITIKKTTRKHQSLVYQLPGSDSAVLGVHPSPV